jgi:hypothetical protein
MRAYIRILRFDSSGLNASLRTQPSSIRVWCHARTAGQEGAGRQDRRQQAHGIREDILANVPEPAEDVQWH